jgi:hypothetical protein
VVSVNVSACIVTRGDVDLSPVLRSLPEDWEILVWDNGANALYEGRDGGRYWNVGDLSVYGRYAAIQYASHEIIYVQDDDVVVSDPKKIVDIWYIPSGLTGFKEGVVCNMPQEFRHSFYEDHALVGFGAAFHRDAPVKAFDLLKETVPKLGLSNYGWWLPDFKGNDHFLRTCDIVFTGLTPRVLVDVPVTNLDHAYSENRMYRQPDHVDERRRMLELALKVRDEPSRVT